jgi:signal transduction histidine kinase
LTQLQNPVDAPQPTVAASAWWAALVARYADEAIEFRCDALDDKALPQAVFDSVADNLIANALRKRRRAASLTVSVHFCASPPQLVVSDDGEAVPGHVVHRLFASSVASESGQGVGLFLAARQAARAGYALSLLENRPGAVRFGLQAGTRQPSTEVA